MSDQIDRLHVWLGLPMPRSRWAFRCREAMQRAALEWLDGSRESDLIESVNSAYQFGPRKYHPYKVWCAEMQALRNCLVADLPAPTDEDFAACEVAIDLSEQGDQIAALKLLDEQAPRRLNRACPVCGAKVRENCLSPSSTVVVVPHLSRVMPSRVNGPLFGGAE